MKVTRKDMEEVMNQIKRDPTKEILSQTAHLNLEMIETEGFKELVTMIGLSIMADSFGKEQDLVKVLTKTSQVSVMAGALIGFRLGLREAGLEMGIPNEQTPAG